MIKVRLNLLADLLESIEALPKTKRKREFDLGTWVRFSGHCGTAACAVGEATFIQRFRDLGLRFSKRQGSPSFRGSTGWEAVQRFFGIDYVQAMGLFAACGYSRIIEQENPITPGVVAAKIRGFVETGSF